LGRAADSRRAAQARNRRLRTDGVAVPAGRPRKPSQTWRTFLANHLGQFTCISHVLSPYAPRDDVVDALARTCRSTRLSDRLSASRPCARIDWPVSVRPRCLGFRFTQDYVRDRRNMRRSASRAPPRTGYVQSTHGGHAEGGFVALALDQPHPLPRETVAGLRSRLVRASSECEIYSFGLRWARLRGDSQTVGLLVKHNRFSAETAPIPVFR
jgi:hypothetical protein